MSAPTWTIRMARASDAAALAALAERTFRDAFGAVNAAEDVDLHCARSFSPARQAAEIADPQLATVVVEHDGNLVGYSQLRRRASPAVGETAAVEVQRFYVLQAWHGTGLARELMRDSIARAETMGARAIWLGVWEHNPRAIRFYEKHGFTAVGEQPFVLGRDPQRDLVMVRPLQAAAEPQAPIR
ncbi:MAG TPA: GNAT family N-acetyltransferase [Thermoanaerobaculia bacterium]|jgi:ribosomal protein S18 acetylase RimI-like enzyme|nr:GNAT family N-acetyltransferase [Thermoanaerobaculia bacterium]